MTVSILLDMNFSPEWVPFLEQGGHQALHWASVGDARDEDATIMAWAAARGLAILTCDLDFGTALALSHARAPSVVQVRDHDVLPKHIGSFVLTLLQRYEAELLAGALVVVEEGRSRIRILPF